jgi:hypothetical protein
VPTRVAVSSVYQVLLLLQWVCADDGELVFILDNAFSWFNDKVHEQADTVGTGV